MVEMDYSKFSPYSYRLATLPADVGQNFKQKLLLKSGNITMGVAGDSTWNAIDEAIDLYMAKLATDYPWLAISIKHWNDATQAYDADAVISAGTADTGGLVFNDTFTRTAADLFGTTPDIGTAWGRDGANATGDWSIDGAKLVRTADATSGNMLANAISQGDQTVSLSGTISSTNTGVARNHRLYFHYASSTDHLFAQIAVSSTGVVSFSLVKRIGNIVTTVASGGGAGMASNTASIPYTLSVSKNGLNVSATLNSTTISGVLSSDDDLAVAGGTQAGFSGSVLQNDTIDNFQINIPNPAPAKKLTLYNASWPGSKLDYQQPRLASMFPVDLDVLLINSGHNYGAASPDAYLDAMSDFIYSFRLLQPKSGIVIASQNPQKAPAQVKLHLARQSVLKSYCKRFNYGYIPIIEAYKALGDGGDSLINSTDGVHPTPGTPNTGSSLSRDTITTYFNGI